MFDHGCDFCVNLGLGWKNKVTEDEKTAWTAWAKSARQLGGVGIFCMPDFVRYCAEVTAVSQVPDFGMAR